MSTSSWKSTRLKFLSKKPLSNGLGVSGEFTNPDWPRFVRISDIKNSTELKSEGFRTLPPDLAFKSKLFQNDILFAAVGATVGKSYIHENENENFCFAGFLVRFSPNLEIRPKFISYWSQSHDFWNQIKSKMVKSTIENFSATKYSNLRIDIPDLKTQDAICKFLEEKTDPLKIISKELDINLNKLESLKIKLIESMIHGIDSSPIFELSNNHLFSQRDERGEPLLPALLVSLNSGVTVRQAKGNLRRQEASDLSNQKIARKGDIVFNKMRMWQGAVGVAPCDGLVSTDYTVAVPLDGVHSEFFMHLFRTIQYRTEINRWSHGIVPDRNRLYWEQFKAMKSSFPTYEKQVEIADKIRLINHRFLKLRELKEKLTDCFNEYQKTIISLAVTGKIDLSRSV